MGLAACKAPRLGQGALHQTHCSHFATDSTQPWLGLLHLAVPPCLGSGGMGSPHLGWGDLHQTHYHGVTRLCSSFLFIIIRLSRLPGLWPSRFGRSLRASALLYNSPLGKLLEHPHDQLLNPNWLYQCQPPQELRTPPLRATSSPGITPLGGNLK